MWNSSVEAEPEISWSFLTVPLKQTEISPKVDSSREFLTVRQSKKGDGFEEVELFY